MNADLLRDHVLSETCIDAPHEAVHAFEASLSQADERSDFRFAAADGSSRLTDMGHRVAKLLLRADQADIRARQQLRFGRPDTEGKYKNSPRKPD
jgi:hypothetical protein